MKIKHRKKYYVGGIFSLIILPLLFLLSTTESRNRAISYGSIQVDVAYGDHLWMKLPYIESTCLFQGSRDEKKLSNLQKFCQSVKSRSDTIYKLKLPEKCTYGFFIQVIDVLRDNKFQCGAENGVVKFAFRPDLNFQQKYEPLSWAEEFEFVRSELSKFIFSIKLLRGGESVVRIARYTDYGPPPYIFGTFNFSPSYSKVKEEPRSAVFFQSIGLWFVPIILIWLLLLVLSITKAKLLPNQALKLTE